MAARCSTITLLAAGSISLCAASAVAGGQDPPPNAQAAEGSYYYEMNWYRTIKLGTAPFFNTELARRAKVAYSFEVEAASGAWVDAEALYRSGKLVPAGIEDDGEYWVPARFDDRDLGQATEALLVSGYERVVYLGESEELPGGIAGDAVVAWDPIPWHPLPPAEQPDAQP